MPLDDDVEAVVMVNGDGDSGDENEDEDDELNNSFPSILDHFKEKISTWNWVIVDQCPLQLRKVQRV